MHNANRTAQSKERKQTMHNASLRGIIATSGKPEKLKQDPEMEEKETGFNLGAMLFAFLPSLFAFSP